MSSKFSHFSYEGDEGVYGRRLRLCPSLQSCETPDLIRSCPDCSQFLLVCCSCRKRFPKITKPCHHFSLLFTDGACRNNGQVGATAGIGFAHGTNEQSWIALPITDEMDSFPKRTSQRAELLAALKGLQYICEVIIPCSHGPGASDGAFIIATDSEYVVKGMTEWLPQWKAHNWRNARNLVPANLDLFQRLDAAMTLEESKQGVKIGFWHISREHNVIADRLAKAAASCGTPT